MKAQKMLHKAKHNMFPDKTDWKRLVEEHEAADIVLENRPF